MMSPKSYEVNNNSYRYLQYAEFILEVKLCIAEDEVLR